MDLSTDTSLVVEISDALSERDKVKFTVHTKVGLNFAIISACANEELVHCVSNDLNLGKATYLLYVLN